MANTRTTRSARLGARIPVELKRRLEYAASLRGTTLTDFLIQSAQEAASRTIRDHEVLTLNEQASREFAGLLLDPPAPNEAAMAAAASYKGRYLATRD